MSEKMVQKIMDETIFTMWAEGFVLTDDEKSTLRKVLLGEIPFTTQLEQYIQDAELMGEVSHV